MDCSDQMHRGAPDCIETPCSTRWMPEFRLNPQHVRTVATADRLVLKSRACRGKRQGFRTVDVTWNHSTGWAIADTEHFSGELISDFHLFCFIALTRLASASAAAHCG